MFNQNGFIGGMVRSQNRAEAIEISGRRYLDAYKCLNLMSTRPYFEDAFKTCGDFAFSPLDFVFFLHWQDGKTGLGHCAQVARFLDVSLCGR